MRRPPFRNVRTLTMNSDTSEPPGPVAAPAGLLPAVAARPVLARIRGFRERFGRAMPGPARARADPRARRGACDDDALARRKRHAPTLGRAPLPTWGAAGTRRGYTRTEADTP